MMQGEGRANRCRVNEATCVESGRALLSCIRPEGPMERNRRGTQGVKRLNAKVLLKLAAVGLVVLAALALGRDVALACDSGSRWLTAELTLKNASVLESAETVLVFEPFDGRGDDCGGGVGDERGVHPCCPCCSGHGPGGSGGVLAPGATGLVAPLLSGNLIVMVYAPAMTGVSRPPDERPPRSF